MCIRDSLICELLCTGQFFEPQVQVVNHLRRYLKEDASLIPRKVRSYLRLMDAQELLYGVRIDVDSRSVLMDDDEPVSTKVLYDELDFSREEKLHVDTTVRVTARKSRLADAVLIEGEAELSPGQWTTPTRFLYNPEVIFLKAVSYTHLTLPTTPYV